MTFIKGHFDGTSIILDEPASLVIGQSVQVVVENLPPAAEETHRSRPSLVGFARGMFEMRNDFDDPLDEFAEYR